ncbi:MAG: UDP-N-acetylglucosamine--N-acetylmuramyl-(pentapeptide) pyrophosphoryl-undecaprenol N-acetylglucosamine transferase [Patescibacteria group bacterium]
MIFNFNKKKIRFVLTGGGTGGHLFPLLAVAEKAQQSAQNQNLSLELSYLGPVKGPFSFDPRILEQRGIKTIPIISESPGNASNPLTAGLSFLKEFFGFLQCLWYLWLIMPDAVFSKGGFGSLPIIFVSFLYRIPVVIHESDVIPGQANQLSKKFASRIAISFEKSIQFFPFEKTALTGNPIRNAFFEKTDRKKAIEFFGFSQELKTVFISGGSQGAKKLNDLTLDSLPQLIENYQVIHQCGSRNYPEVSRGADFTLKGQEKQKQSRYKLFGFMDEQEIKSAYAAADLIIARAGSGSIFEISAQAKPSILIPLSTAAKDHQRENAYAYAKTGAAIVLEENNLKPHIFFGQMDYLLKNQEKLRSMSEAAKSFSKPKAAETIAKELFVIAGA